MDPVKRLSYTKFSKVFLTKFATNTFPKEILDCYFVILK